MRKDFECDRAEIAKTLDRLLEIAAAWCEREGDKNDRRKIAEVNEKEAAAKLFGRQTTHFYHWSGDQWEKVKELAARRRARIVAKSQRRQHLY